MTEANVSERAQQLLKMLVERYIRDGQPVGSKVLAQELPFGLSSATIRNILADLEERGFLESPHTSAGRVPTVLGYRFFIDSLLTIKPLKSAQLADLRHELSPELNAQELVESASKILARLTQFAGIVTLPKREKARFKHLEFVSLSDNRILVILVFNSKDIQNRIIHTRRLYTSDELQQTAQFINQHFQGEDLSTVREKVIEALKEDKEHLHKGIQSAFEITENDYIMAGEGNLVAGADTQNDLKDLFTAFTRKQDILHLLDQCLGAHGVQIFIGAESGFNLLKSYSVITAPYFEEGGSIGVLGVIGPTRMAYDRVIPAVDVTAKLLSAALKQG